jgi:hypothetical protein
MNNTGIKKVALRNKRHFEEKNGKCAACLKYAVLIFVGKKIYIYIYNATSGGQRCARPIYGTHGS